jgi:hypothetical protein
MGVTTGCLGGMTPICNLCGIKLCFEIDPIEYEQSKLFWDNWKCSDCDSEYKFKRREIM